MFKDTKEGETHSYNDGCGEPAHNPKLPQHIEAVSYTHLDVYKRQSLKTCNFVGSSHDRRTL